METVISILNKTTDFFAKYGVESPRLDAELLLASVLGIQRMQLYLDYERPLTEDVLDQLRPLLKRRASREPIQYILGSTGFMDFELFTDSRALIPRPETEELIERIGEDLSASPPARVLDLGTGTGAIACALARVFAKCEVVATDVSVETLQLALKNIEHLGLSDRVRCVESDWFEAVDGRFDLIVSNPPYLSDEQLEAVAPELKKFEPGRALSSGKTGMECIEILLSRHSDYLAVGGSMYLETGCDQESAIMEYACTLGIEAQVECLSDLNRKQRFVRLKRS